MGRAGVARCVQKECADRVLRKTVRRVRKALGIAGASEGSECRHGVVSYVAAAAAATAAAGEREAEAVVTVAVLGLLNAHHSARLSLSLHPSSAFERI